jgi:hypothetical protein
MDLFNTKKIAELKELYNSNCIRLCNLEKDNRALKEIAFEQYKKYNKPKFKIGSKVEYNLPAYNSYISYKGIIFNINVDIDCSGELSFFYDISVKGEVKRVIESNYLRLNK